MGDPETTRGRTLLGRFKPRSHALACQHRLEGISAGKLDTDTTRRCEHRSLHLCRHAARTHARSRTGHEHAHQIIGARHTRDQLRPRVIWRSSIKTIDISEQNESISLNHLRNEGSEAIIVAEAQLSGGHRIILVQNRNDAEAEEARQRGTHVRVVVTAHDVVRGQQHLGGIEVMRLESSGPTRHQEPLPHRRRGLHARQVLRLRREAERIKPGSDRTRRHDDDLPVCPAPARNKARDRVDPVEIQTAIFSRQ